MEILEYYLEQQKFPNWVKKFQSTSNKQSGKTFSYINTNYRHLISFLSQTALFETNNGKERNEWKTMKGSGQEKDKHRVINLINAGILKFETDCFLFDSKGYTVQDLIQLKASEEEKWILLYLLILDYKTEERDMDIIRTYFEMIDYLKSAGVNFVDLIPDIKKAMYVENTEMLFMTDVFWIISFAKDKSFIQNFLNSTEEEKTKLKKYVIRDNKKEYSASKDCIGHKFAPGGAYSTATFKDDLKMLLMLDETVRLTCFEFSEFIDKIINTYATLKISVDKEKINRFIQGHRSVYNKVYNHVEEFLK